jgi:hypothetical protein
MRWYQVDSDTPNDPKIKRLLNDATMAAGGREAGAEAIGHLFLVWCFVANHGAQPGLGVKPDGSPLDLDDLAYEAAFRSTDDLRTWLDTMAERGLIDPDQWKDHGVVFLPAMKSRADAYAKSKGRGPGHEPDPQAAASGGNGAPWRGGAGKSGTTRARPGPKGPLHNKTLQDITKEKDLRGLAATPVSADLLAEAGTDTVDALVAVWNAERKPGPEVRDLTPQRRERYQRAIKAKPDLADWRQVIRWLNTQPWCNAKGTGDHRTWRATLDWLAKPGKLAEYLDKAAGDRGAVRPDGTEGRDAAKGRTGFKRGEFGAALKGGDDAIH